MTANLDLLAIYFFANVLLWPFKFQVLNGYVRLNIIIVFLVFLYQIIFIRKILSSSLKKTTVVFLIILISIIISAINSCSESLLKAINSAPLLLLLCFCAIEIAKRANSDQWQRLELISIFCILITLLSIGFEYFFPEKMPAQYVYRTGGIYSGIFDEPSHLGFSLMPCFSILLFSRENKMQVIGLLLLMLMAYVSPSSTLLLEIPVLVCAYLIIKRKWMLFISAITIGFLIFPFRNYLDNSVIGFIDKIFGVLSLADSNNMSSVVFIQGWQDAMNYLWRTGGLGVGFNSMGCNPLPDVPAREILAIRYNAPLLNSEDGSFLFSKGVSEFGIAFILLICFGLYVGIKSLLNSRNLCEDNPLTTETYIQVSILFTVTFTMFIRSSSYFTSNFPLFLLVLFALINKNKKFS